MSKSKGHKRPNLPPAAMLRARLDQAWQNPAWLEQTTVQVEAGLEAAARGVRPDLLVLTMVRAFLTAPEAARRRLEAVLPGWLERQGALGALQTLASSGTLESEGQQAALAWLAAAGQDTTAIVTAQAESFFAAYLNDNGMQATLALFHYSDARHTRVRGVNFLMDHNPPWDGAVKDIMLYPQRPPDEIEREYLATWAERGIPMRPIEASEAKHRIMTALAANRTAQIRLPRDLAANREAFTRMVLPLPGQPETPSFTLADFDALSRGGRSAEEIRKIEQTIGGLMRLPDGTEVFVGRDPLTAVSPEDLADAMLQLGAELGPRDEIGADTDDEDLA